MVVMNRNGVREGEVLFGAKRFANTGTGPKVKT
jgi:hypothetical protein